jgi:hypothetical protein
MTGFMLMVLSEGSVKGPCASLTDPSSHDVILSDHESAGMRTVPKLSGSVTNVYHYQLSLVGAQADTY